MSALPDQVRVELTNRRQEAVRIVSLIRRFIFEAETEPITDRRLDLRQERTKQTAAKRFHRARLLAAEQRATRGIRVKGANDHTGLAPDHDLVWTEQGMRSR